MEEPSVPAQTAPSEEEETSVESGGEEPTPEPEPEPEPEPVPVVSFSFTDAQIASLEKLFAERDGRISLIFHDINSGYTYSQLPEKDYFVASIIKAPYCLYLLQLAESGELDLSEKLVYESRFYSGGTGDIQKKPVGSVFTIDELIRYCIERSDNIGFRMLLNRYPAQGFVDWAEKLGIKNLEGIKDLINGRINADDAMIYLKAINAYIKTDTPGAKKLKEHMLNTINPIIFADYPVIRKYGWAKGAYHDIAIIDAPNPYLLVLLTDCDEANASDRGLFWRISYKIQEFTDQENRESLETSDDSFLCHFSTKRDSFLEKTSE